MAAYTAIDDPEAYFQVKTYTGDSGTATAHTFDGTNDMQPDLVWIKGRNSAENNVVIDSVRGGDTRVYTDGAHAEGTNDMINSFDSDGFTLNNSSFVNYNTYTYVARCWKESATSGFDIVTYTGNETARTIAHSLSAVPHCMLFKNREGVTNWIMYHHSLGNTYGMVLNEAEDLDDQAHYFNDTTPTSSVFTVGDGAQTNGDADGASTIAYLWSEKQGFSKFGTYEGTNNADGTFVFTGFTPAFVMVKNVDEGSGPKWVIQDTKRSPSLGGNPAEARLKPNDNTAEEADSDIDLLSNGFKIRSTGSYTNDAQTYIYVAFAEAPFVNSNGVPCNAR